MYGKYGSDIESIEHEEIEDEEINIDQMLEGLDGCKDGTEFMTCCTYTITKRRPVPCAYCKFTLFKYLEEMYGFKYSKKRLGKRLQGECHLCGQSNVPISMGHIRPLSGADCKYHGYRYDNIIGTCDNCEMLVGCNSLTPLGDENFALRRYVNNAELTRFLHILSSIRYKGSYTIRRSNGNTSVLEMKFICRNPNTEPMKM